MKDVGLIMAERPSSGLAPGATLCRAIASIHRAAISPIPWVATTGRRLLNLHEKGERAEAAEEEVARLRAEIERLRGTSELSQIL